MSVSTEILHPLVASSVTREYRLKHPLKYIATKFSQKTPSSRAQKATPICVLIATGIGCTSHLWIPVIKHLYSMHEQQDTHIHILSIWVVDRPNHGDAAVLNVQILDEYYRDFFPSAEYGAAIFDFVNSGLLSAEEKGSLVALGHSGGGAGIIDSIPLNTDGPYKLIIMMEPVYIEEDPETIAVFDRFSSFVAAANAKEATSWPSIKLAMESTRKRMPWRAFDAENLRILAETLFRPLADGGVAAKTPSRQRTVSLLDIWSAYVGTRRVIDMLPNVPFHAIVGSVYDLWPEHMNNAITTKTEEMQKMGLGVTTVRGAGHYLPHEKPEASAIAIFGALSRISLRAKL
ncbi:hypothetical protein OF83DRAFT_772059 [Amylostereum chailletii]|nr:hypothetical protein OF83DRAFT_772059 [Amylostereum chailletii]